MSKFRSLFWNECNAKLPPSYTQLKRDTEYLEWAYGKIAYASAGGIDTVWGKTNMPSSKGFTNPTNEETIYKLQGRGGKNNDPVYIPPIHLTNVKTSAVPDSFGTVRKGSFSFKTYSPGQLDSKGALFKPGNDVTITYGWAYGDKKLGGESFSGKITNFNIQLNSEGGYDCTVEAIGPATVTLAGLNSMAPITVAASAVTDAKGNNIAIANIYSAIVACDTEAINLPTGPATFNNGIVGCVVEIPENYDKSDTSADTDNANKVKKAYVTVQSILNLVNKMLSDYATGVQMNFAPDGYSEAVTDPSIKAANPLEVLVPGLSTYGDKNFTTGGDSPYNGQKVSLPNFLISAEYLAKISKIEVVDTADKKQKTFSLKSFWDKIFGIVNENIGRPFALTLSQNADISDRAIYIVDANAINSGITPRSINTVRSANLSAALDSETAAMFWIKNSIPTEKPQEAAMQNKGAAPLPTDYDSAVNAVGQKCVPGSVSALRSLNVGKVQNVLKQATNISINAPFELSLTLDGCTGWEYGNAITTGYLPKTFAPIGSKIGFVVTNIEHNVQDGDWTTTISTACKFYK